MNLEDKVLLQGRANDGVPRRTPLPQPSNLVVEVEGTSEEHGTWSPLSSVCVWRSNLLPCGVMQP